MSFVINLYKKNFLTRYDFDVAIPYYTVEDFKGLKEETGSFNNDNKMEIHYFIYFYPNYKKGKVILFLPGIGPGHRAYFKEINELAKAGYKVLTLDYQGTGYSKGKRLTSIYRPTMDVKLLLDHLKIKDEIILVGHSLGAFTALNVINQFNLINKAVIISGFIDVKRGMRNFVKSRLLSSHIAHYEKKLHEDLASLNNRNYLKNTTDKLLFIQSEDDKLVSYKLNTKEVMKLNNKNLSFIIEKDKNHNPNYTVEAVKLKDQVINDYMTKVNNKVLKTKEERIDYFKDINIDDLTVQDERIISKIINFIG